MKKFFNHALFHDALSGQGSYNHTKDKQKVLTIGKKIVCQIHLILCSQSRNLFPFVRDQRKIIVKSHKTIDLFKLLR